jgi:pyroglutamyl-peptidase
MKRLLISGFEAFGAQAINPTQVVVEAIARNEIAVPTQLELHPLLLPVTFEDAFKKLEKEINSIQPDIIICFGQAGGRAHIELERVAINVLDADIPDNKGHQPRDLKIDESGENAYFSTLPLRHLEKALQGAQIPVKISNSAGTYVCNYLFYCLMKSLRDPQIMAGFIHVPYLPEQAPAGVPSMDLESLRRAVSVLLEALIME